jgi:hypothetical protein
LQKQVEFLEAHPDFALVGTRAEIWVGDRRTRRMHDHPTDNAALQFELLFDNPFVHSSMLLRRSALDVVGYYCTDPARQPPEDYELWSRIARRFRVANLPEHLTIYREVSNSMSRNRTAAFVDKIVTISAENLAAATGAGSPGRVHWDIAALTHRAVGRTSATPDIDSMCQTIREAGDRIIAHASDSDVPMRVTQRIANLRYALALFGAKSDPSARARLALSVAIARRVRRKLVSLYDRYAGNRSGRGSSEP